jgi:hypothetical protein
VKVPPSPLAPHLVTVNKLNRFYGRSGKINIILNEGEIARLYQRREALRADPDLLLDETIKSAPFLPDPNYIYLHLMAKPQLARKDLVAEAAAAGGDSDLDFIVKLAQRASQSGVYEPTSVLSFNNPQVRPLASGWLVYLRRTEEHTRSPDHALDLTLGFNGTLSLFCGRMSEPRESYLVVYDDTVVEMTVRFIFFLMNLYKTTYQGPVDIGLALTGLEGAYSMNGRTPYFGGTPFKGNEYRRTMRVFADRLEVPKAIAKELLAHFFHAMVLPYPTD